MLLKIDSRTTPVALAALLVAATSCSSDGSNPNDNNTGGMFTAPGGGGSAPVAGGAGAPGVGTGGTGGTATGGGGGMATNPPAGAGAGSTPPPDGTGGTDTTGGPMAFACAGSTPTTGISDFESNIFEEMSEQRWGESTGFFGGFFSYGGPTHSIADGALLLDGTVSDYAGVGMWMADCIDASAFTGIRFRISGNTNEETVTFRIQINDTYFIGGQDGTEMKGGCDDGDPDGLDYSECAHHGVDVTVTETSTLVHIPWADLTGGSPVPFDPAQILGLQWELPWASGKEEYPVSIAIDDIQFYTDVDEPDYEYPEGGDISTGTGDTSTGTGDTSTGDTSTGTGDTGTGDTSTDTGDMSTGGDTTTEVSFADVYPIFTQNCVTCHGDDPQGKPSLANSDMATAQQAAEANASRIVTLINGEGEDGPTLMPPGGPLGQADIDIIEAWAATVQAQ